jgi:predicted CopG family antitoxin
MRQLLVGFATEGNTDSRFLESVIFRALEWIVFTEYSGQIEVLPLVSFDKEKGTFSEVVMKYAQKAYETGVMVLCIHVDADADTDEHVFINKINPAFEEVVKQVNDIYCKNLVALVPVRMTEAWMLADKELLKRQLGVNSRDADLGIHRKPEQYADPKEAIRNAIRIAFEDSPRRRDNLDIADLYTPIGQSIDLEKLRKLSSFSKFEDAIREALRKINYLKP